MKTYLSLTTLALSMLLVTGACVSSKKLAYLQYNDKYSNGINTSVTPSAYKIMPYDNLYIRVITPDPQWSSLFNMMPVGAGGTVTEESAALLGYPVDQDGNIEIPFVGKVSASGKTLSELKVGLDTVFKNYVSDAAITVRLVNNYISVIGEVNAPGRYQISKDRLNILEALSFAGDLSVYANRNKILLIRPSPYGPIVKEFSLVDRSIFASEYYYVLPNDIIYASPVRGRSFRENSAIFSLLLSTVTTALVVIGFFR